MVSTVNINAQTVTGTNSTPMTRSTIADGVPRSDDRSLSESISSFIQTSDIQLDDATWLALTDTVSDEFTTVTLAQVQTGLISDITSKLTDYQNVADELSATSTSSADYEDLLLRLEQIEQDISNTLGQTTLKKTATFTVETSDTASDYQVINRLTLSDLGNSDNELIQVEISGSDYLNGYHLADGCPICRAEMAALGASTANSPELDETATTNSSNGSASTGSITASGTNYIDPLLKLRAWDFNEGESLSYSFYRGDGVVPYTASYSEPYEQHSSEIPDAQKDELRATYAIWSNYAPFEFEEVTETAQGLVVGDLRNAYISRYSGDDLDGTAAFAYYPYTSSVGGDTWYVEPNEVSTNATFADDTYGRMTALHEIGHSIGLKHPFDGSSGTNETLTGNGLTDTMRQSVMSYTRSDYVTFYEDSGSLTSKNIYSNTPMIYDIAAVEYLYGAITDANLGDTTYTFADTDHQRIQTLVDSGGTDTIDLSNARHRSIVDLTPGSLLSIGYATESEQEAYWAAQGFSLAAVQSTITPTQLFKGNDNVGIAFSATIENVIGSAGDDELTGNTADNELTGGSGDDTLDGGSGSDTAIFSGTYAQYTITDNNDGTHTITDTTSDRDGTDTVQNIESLRFSDKTYTLSGPNAGSATVNEGVTEVLDRGSSKISSGGSYLRAASSSFGGGLAGPHGFAGLAQLLLSQNSASSIRPAISAAADSFRALSESSNRAQMQSLNRQLSLISSAQPPSQSLITSSNLRSAYSEVNSELVNSLLS